MLHQIELQRMAQNWREPTKTSIVALDELHPTDMMTHHYALNNVSVSLGI